MLASGASGPVGGGGVVHVVAVPAVHAVPARQMPIRRGAGIDDRAVRARARIVAAGRKVLAVHLATPRPAASHVLDRFRAERLRGACPFDTRHKGMAYFGRVVRGHLGLGQRDGLSHVHRIVENRGKTTNG